MSKKWLFIQAQDVWMFRDSKPFTAGESFTARSSFPPNPQTMQGIIRTHVIEQSEVRWDDYGQRRDESLIEKIGAPATKDNKYQATLGNFEIRGAFVGRCQNGTVELLVPTPLDVMKKKKEGNEDKETLVLAKPQAATFETDAPFGGWQPLTIAETGEYEPAGGWLTQTDFQKYLRGEVPSGTLKDGEVFIKDERTGLALDYKKRTSLEGMLYFTEFIRPQDKIGLLVEVDADLPIPDKGYIGTGGEARSGYYETVDFKFPEPAQTQTPSQLKIVLLTPAYFSGGWQPENGDWSPWVGENAQLVSMAIGKPTFISGWDMVRKEPKTLHHYLPAGSVFYFKDALPPDYPFTEAIRDNNFEGGYVEAGRLGFGGFAVGSW